MVSTNTDTNSEYKVYAFVWNHLRNRIYKCPFAFMCVDVAEFIHMCMCI